MMSELSPAARALLDAAREGMSPSPDALRRVRGKVGAAAAGGSGAALIMKLSLVVVVAGIVAGAIGISSRRSFAAIDAAIPTIYLGNSSSMMAESRASAFEAPPPAAPIETATIEMPAERASRLEAAPAEPRLADPKGVPPPKLDLAREVELVDAAMAALKAGDANAALASVRVHREETHGAGQLAEDAAAIEIEALCRLKDRRVAAKLEAFDVRWPESAQRSRLTTNCP